jgi:hypothetical protein
MTNAPGARGRETGEDTAARTDADLLFPSEGTFSTVVPLSQVGRAQVSASRRATAAPRAPEEPEEATLVPRRVSRRARAGSAYGTKGSGLPRLAAAAVVALSVVAGVAAGAYLVGWQGTPEARQQTTADAQQPVTPVEGAAAPEQAATEIPGPEPAPASAPPAPEVTAQEEGDTAAEGNVVASVERAEPSGDAPKASARASAPSAARAAEPAPHRAAETEARAPVRERAKAEASAPSAPPPAPKPARRETPPRRDAAPARTRTPATASTRRSLPVSTPPPSARPRTVIQWP